ncbi:MAG: Pathogenicity locus [Gammaproteobacteria bacterium]|nr:MAG: Pathogenicity locus [Gammaproteobacteria bacterium]
MGFSNKEKQKLLAVKGVGDTVILRLEQMGFSTLKQLAKSHVDDILRQGVAITGSTCWSNSPQAKKAIQSAIDCAKGA